MSIKGLLGDRRALSFGLALLCGYGLLVVAGATGSLLFFTIASALSAVGEVAARRVSGSLQLLGRLRITPMHRHLARDSAVLLLLGQSDVASAPTVIMVALLMVGVWAVSVGTGAAAVLIRRAVAPPIVTHNIDLSGLRFPAQPKRVVMAVTGERALYLNALLVPGAIIASLVSAVAPLFAAAAAVAAAAAAIAVGMSIAFAQAWRAPSREATLEAIRARVRPDPKVLLHFAGSGRDAYQVNMWLQTVEALDEPALVLLRERSCFNALAPTSLPVVCIPNSVNVMNFGYDSVRVALHPSNVGSNIHILREPGMKHVFVGHGDSDKIASINPYTKVYDEVWVAGRAGRDRYAIADVGVRDEAIVEVGRPQLAGLSTTGSSLGGAYTILYAPTWEGWIEDPYATSLLLLGEQVVRILLEMSPPVRFWYKPHPLTGKRSRQATEVHQRLVQLITAAGGGAGPASPTALRKRGHYAFTGSTPDLHECLNHSDLLISDVSSVVSDWVATRKPYAVGNPGDLPEDDFRRLYPTARAAYLLSSSGAALEKIVQVVRAGDDPMAPERSELKEYLLGPDEPSAMERFQAEVTRLCALSLPRQRSEPASSEGASSGLGGRNSVGSTGGPAGHGDSGPNSTGGPHG